MSKFPTDMSAKTNLTGSDLVLIADSADSNNAKKTTMSDVLAYINPIDGDVKWPVSSTSGNLAVFDGSTGKIIKDGWPVTGLIPIKKVVWVSWTSWTTKIVTDADCTTASSIIWWTVTGWTQIWFWEFTMAAGQFTITSTTQETWLTFNYILYI